MEDLSQYSKQLHDLMRDSPADYVPIVRQAGSPLRGHSGLWVAP